MQIYPLINAKTPSSVWRLNLTATQYKHHVWSSDFIPCWNIVIYQKYVWSFPLKPAAGEGNDHHKLMRHLKFHTRWCVLHGSEVLKVSSCLSFRLYNSGALPGTRLVGPIALDEPEYHFLPPTTSQFVPRYGPKERDDLKNVERFCKSRCFIHADESCLNVTEKYAF